MIKLSNKFFVVLLIFAVLVFSGCIQPQMQDQQNSADNQTKNPFDVGENSNTGKSDIPVELCGNGIVDSLETCTSCAADVKCKETEECKKGECVAKLIIPKEKDPTYNCTEICALNEFCNLNGECESVELKNTNYCGNFVCEAGEKYAGKVLKVTEMGTQCYADCSSPKNSGYANDSVEVDCGCSEYEAMADRHGCINDAQPCTDCGVQETLFPEVLKVQTEIYNCLVDYFKYKPNKLVYKVFNNPNLEKCPNKEGCTGIEGGAGGADYVMFHNLNGFRAYNEVVPTKPEYIQADVHETAHFFVYQMLHAVPSWFQEVVAIQTNGRLKCSTKQSAWGDAYFKEGSNSGINMADGTVLNGDFYKRFREGKTTLSEEEKKNHYIAAVLFIHGLEQDYSCGFYCIRDIVLKLHEYELKQCSTDANACGIQKFVDTYIYMWIDGSEEAANKKILEATLEITGKDVTPLFNLLEIGKYEPLKSPCGDTSTCQS